MASLERSLSSSPDPLSLCDENFPTPSPIKRRRSSITPRKPLINTSGNAAVQDFYISNSSLTKEKLTPTKPSRQRNSSSPWRIRLTVQADPLDQNGTYDGGNTLLHMLEDQTIITKIPLKGGEDSSPATPLKKRGRPRKSNGSPVKRNGTPKPKARHSNSSSAMPSKRPEGIGSAKTTPTKGSSARALPSKRDYKSGTPESAVDDNVHGSSVMAAKEKRSKSRNRRKEITPMKLPISFNESSQVSLLNLIDSPKEPKVDKPDAKHASYESSMNDIRTPLEVFNVKEPEGTSFLDRNDCVEDDEAMWRSMIRDSTQSPQISNQNTISKPIVDPTNEHYEFDSILDSEGFSMVSVSSLPSAGLHSISPAEQNGGFVRGQEPDNPTTCAPALPPEDHSVHGYSDISSIEQDPAPFTFTSSIIANPEANKTPICVTSAQSPPAPRPAENMAAARPLNEPSDGTPKLARIVRAGNALQGAVNPDEDDMVALSKENEAQSDRRSNTMSLEYLEDCSTQSSASESHLQDPFDVSGSDTKKTFRAELRTKNDRLRRPNVTSLLEEQSSIAETFNEARQIIQKLKKSDQEARNTSQEETTEAMDVSYPVLPTYQLPSPTETSSEHEEESTHLGTTIIKPLTAAQEGPSFTSHASPSLPPIDHTMLAKEAEWQREREAVSKQIQMANSSQVIVIDSDNSKTASFDEESQVAHQSPTIKYEEPSDMTYALPDPGLACTQGSPASGQPKQDSLQSFDSSIPETSHSGLFWQPDEAHIKVSRRRHERKRQNRVTSSSPREVRPSPSLSKDRASDDSTSTLLSQLMVNSAHDSSDSSQSEIDAETSPRAKEESLPQTPPQKIDGEMDISEGSAASKISSLVKSSTTLSGKSQPERIQEDSPIDPAILHQGSAATQTEAPSLPPQGQTGSSWFGALAKPLTSLFFSASTTTASKPASSSTYPPATKSDILCSSKSVPLFPCTPWTTAHFQALEPLYLAAFLYGTYIFPFDPHSRSARYKGSLVETSLGWQRRVNEMDCGVADAFMVLLAERSQKYKPTPPVTAGINSVSETIDEAFVVKMCVQVWSEMVMRGDVELQEGQKSGQRMGGDRAWTTDDIRWDECQKTYHARKKRTWGGLPSWRQKGVVWKPDD